MLVYDYCAQWLLVRRGNICVSMSSFIIVHNVSLLPHLGCSCMIIVHNDLPFMARAVVYERFCHSLIIVHNVLSRSLYLECSCMTIVHNKCSFEAQMLAYMQFGHCAQCHPVRSVPSTLCTMAPRALSAHKLNHTIHFV